ncbi:MAG: hypothetical protein KJ709_08490 [Nanoarchaeota archaeon]|nr:hypothetical protein [Nanoarchaeota archaeon]
MAKKNKTTSAALNAYPRLRGLWGQDQKYFYRFKADNSNFRNAMDRWMRHLSQQDIAQAAALRTQERRQAEVTTGGFMSSLARKGKPVIAFMAVAYAFGLATALPSDIQRLKESGRPYNIVYGSEVIDGRLISDQMNQDNMKFWDFDNHPAQFKAVIDTPPEEHDVDIFCGYSENYDTATYASPGEYKNLVKAVQGALAIANGDPEDIEMIEIELQGISSAETDEDPAKQAAEGPRNQSLGMLRADQVGRDIKHELTNRGLLNSQIKLNIINSNVADFPDAVKQLAANTGYDEQAIATAINEGGKPGRPEVIDVIAKQAKALVDDAKEGLKQDRRVDIKIKVTKKPVVPVVPFATVPPIFPQGVMPGKNDIRRVNELIDRLRAHKRKLRSQVITQHFDWTAFRRFRPKDFGRRRWGSPPKTYDATGKGRQHGPKSWGNKQKRGGGKAGQRQGWTKDTPKNQERGKHGGKRGGSRGVARAANNREQKILRQVGTKK